MGCTYLFLGQARSASLVTKKDAQSSQVDEQLVLLQEQIHWYYPLFFLFWKNFPVYGKNEFFFFWLTLAQN